jgi:creatinine amidohydrolase
LFNFHNKNYPQDKKQIIMKKIMAFLYFSAASLLGYAQSTLPIQYDELSGPQVIEAARAASGICLLPFGILEKHGAHLPLSTDLIIAREIALKAAQKEYCVVFPAYYFGQINEARHQPGAIAYRYMTLWDLLQETLNELSRNGFKKIIIVNGHGGNNDFIHYFLMSQLDSPKDYIVVNYEPKPDTALVRSLEKLLDPAGYGHAGSDETSMVLAIRPDLVHPELASKQSGEDLKRLASINDQYTGIWWYARFPNHYGGESSNPSVEYGKKINEFMIDQLEVLIKELKSSSIIEELQQEFYEKSKNPLNTKQ